MKSDPRCGSDVRAISRESGMKGNLTGSWVTKTKEWNLKHLFVFHAEMIQGKRDNGLQNSSALSLSPPFPQLQVFI